jgi:hypothetical protein
MSRQSWSGGKSAAVSALPTPISFFIASVCATALLLFLVLRAECGLRLKAYVGT